MDKINTALKMIMEKFKEEFGEDAKYEDGDEIVGVFNDAVITLSMNDGNFKVNIVAGEPYVFDYNLDMLEKQEE